MEKIEIRFQEITTEEKSSLHLFLASDESANTIKSVFGNNGYHAKLSGNVLELSKNIGYGSIIKHYYIVKLDSRIHTSNLCEIFRKHSFSYDSIKHQEVMARTAQLQLLRVIRYINTGLF